MDTKQVIVIRTKYQHPDGSVFTPRKGKLIVQACHAAMAFLTRQLQGKMPIPRFNVPDMYAVELSVAAKNWIDSNFAKICLQVDSEQELLDIEAKAKELGVECHMATDSGLTEFHGVSTRTCLALGPDLAEKIDQITGKLQLY